MASKIFAAALAALVTLSALAAEEVVDFKFYDRGFEKLTFDSRTCTGNYSTPSWSCKPVQIPGYLLRAADSSKNSVVFVSHGTQGLDSRHAEYAKQLAANGINAIVMGHWRGRDVGIVHRDYDKWARLGGTAQNQAIDIHMATTQLKEMPEWMNAKVGHMGESMGGSTALNLTRPYLKTAVTGMLGRPPASLSATVALYPGCFDRNTAEGFLSTPILFILGADDNDTPAVACQKQATWMNGRGGKAQLLTLVNQGHDFDAPYDWHEVGNAQNPHKCANLREGDQLTLDVNGQRFTEYREMMRACIALATEKIWAGNKGNQKTGYAEWTAFFREQLR